MVSDPPKVTPFPSRIVSNQELIAEALEKGCTQVKVIPVKEIALGHWVRLRCQYGCSYFGKRFTCPTFSPDCDEMGDILREYKRALILQTPKSEEVNSVILALESSFKQRGFFKAFGLDALPCNLCETCNIELHCEYPDKARPTLHACGIDVPQTLSNISWDFAVQFQPCTENHSIGMVLVD